MAFRILIEFPALDRFAAALERYLDLQEGTKELVQATAALNASSDRTQAAVAAGQPIT